MFVNFHSHTADLTTLVWDNSQITGFKWLKNMMPNPIFGLPRATKKQLESKNTAIENSLQDKSFSSPDPIVSLSRWGLYTRKRGALETGIQIETDFVLGGACDHRQLTWTCLMSASVSLILRKPKLIFKPFRKCI